MKNKNLIGIEWNYKNLSFFALLLILPNLLGMINLPIGFGLHIHFFQIAIFIAALIYGPAGGFFSGLIGSVYSGFMMHNPYLVIGNAILGFFVGYFTKKGFNAIISVALAFIIQIPYLFVTDYYFVHLSAAFIFSIIIALAISDFIWAVCADYFAKIIKEKI